MQVGLKILRFAKSYRLTDWPRDLSFLPAGGEGLLICEEILIFVQAVKRWSAKFCKTVRRSSFFQLFTLNSRRRTAHMPANKNFMVGRITNA